MLYMVRLRARFVSRVCLENMPSRVSYPTASHLPIGRDSRTLQKASPPKATKNFPHVPAILKSETNFHFLNGGGLVGKFWEGQGGLEGEAAILQSKICR